MVYAAVGNCSYVPTPQEVHFMNNTPLVLGPFLLYPAAVWLLTGIVLVLTANYFSAFPKDPRSLKGFILVVLLLNVLKAVQAIGLAWRKFIVNFGDYANIVTLTYVERTNVLLSSAGSALAQLFLIKRCWKLSKFNPAHRLSGYIFLVSVSLAWLLEVAGAIWVTFELPKNYVNSAFLAAVNRLPPAAHLVTDVLITSFTLFYLISGRTGFKSTDSLLTRLQMLLIQSAVPPMVFAALWLVFAGFKEPGLQSLVHSALPGLDAISVLYSLNARAEFKRIGETSGKVDTLGDISFAKSQGGDAIALQERSRGVGVTVTVSQFRDHDEEHAKPPRRNTLEFDGLSIDSERPEVKRGGLETSYIGRAS